MNVNVCAASDKEAPKSLTLPGYIAAMGARLDCYFTLEWHDQDEYAYHACMIPTDSSVDSIKTLIEKFRRDRPDMEAVQDADNPMVIHLKKRLLKSHKDQLLDQKAAIRYKGAVYGLPDVIARRVNGGFGTPKYIDYPLRTPADTQTIVEIKAENRPVCNILSDYLPLSRYASLLWLALDNDASGSGFMQIFYNGPTTSNPYSGDAKDKTKIYPFSDGRNAYFLNPLSEKLTDEATKFITDGFQSDKTLNVRWSMYYLGKHKVESAIPLLLEHLDYRYTTVPVLAEAYPAVHALLDMGKPATSAIQKQLTTETDPLRLQLLCAVLLGIHGAYDGRRLTAETAAKLPEAQEKPIRDALRVAEEQIIAVPPPVDYSKPNAAP